MSSRSRLPFALALLLLAPAIPNAQQATAPRHRELFPPQDLGLLEAPDRAAWQKPEQIMDALGIADGARVADIGAGAGWFTTRLAVRVGPQGIVYAQDIQPQMLQAIRRRVQREGLQNVRTVLGEGSSPNLPPHALDAVLVVDAYPEVKVEDRVTFLKNVTLGLKPNGRIGIVNWRLGGGGPGPDASLRVPRASLESDAAAAGLKVKAVENLPYQYLLVLGR
jgi:predicted methyltransferase